MDAALIGIYLLLIVGVDTVAVLIWLHVLRRADANAADKGGSRHIALFFRLGLLSVPLAFLLYGTYGSIGSLLYSPSLIGSFTEMFVLVGPVEEGAKFAVFFLFARRRDTVKEPLDGMLQAMSVAVAFAGIENFLYGFSYGLGVLLYRSVISFAGHLSYAAVWGFAAGVYLYCRKKGCREPGFSFIIYTLIIAAALHGLYNFSLSFYSELPGLLVKTLSVAVALTALGYLKQISPYQAPIPIRKWKEGTARLKEELKAHPESRYFNLRIAKHYLYGGCNGDARRHLQRVLRISRKDPSALLLLNVIDFTEGNREKAIANFRTIRKKVGRRAFLRLIAEAKSAVGRRALGAEAVSVLYDVAYDREIGLRTYTGAGSGRERAVVGQAMDRRNPARTGEVSTGSSVGGEEENELLERKRRALVRIMRSKFGR